MNNNIENDFFRSKIAEALNLIAEKAKSDVSKIDLDKIDLAEKILESGNSELINANANLLDYAFMTPVIEDKKSVNTYQVSTVKFDYFTHANCQAANSIYNLKPEKTLPLKIGNREIATVKLTYDDLLKQGRTPKEYELNGVDLFVMDAIISLYSSHENVEYITINQICKMLMNKSGKLRKSDLKEKEIKWSVTKLKHTYLNYSPSDQEYIEHKDAFDEIVVVLDEDIPLLDLNKANVQTHTDKTANGYHIKTPPLFYLLSNVYNQNLKSKEFLSLTPKCKSISERALLFYLYMRVKVMKTCSNIIELDTLNNRYPQLTPRKIREKTKEFLQEFKQKELITDFAENKKQKGKITGYTFYPIGYFINKKEVSNGRS